MRRNEGKGKNISRSTKRPRRRKEEGHEEKVDSDDVNGDGHFDLVG